MSLSLTVIIEQFLTWFAVYGLPVLGLAVFVTAAGIPLPSTLFVIAAGAFMRQGILDVVLTPLCVLVSAVLGDAVSYGMGRWARVAVPSRYSKRPTWSQAQTALRERGGAAIYLTRWLLTAFAVPTNLAAGCGGYPLGRFLAFDVAGEATWLLVFGGLGYAFGSQWEAISDLASNFSGLLVGVVLLVTGVYLLAGRRFSTLSGQGAETSQNQSEDGEAQRARLDVSE